MWNSFNPSFRDDTAKHAEGIASDGQTEGSKVTVDNPETGMMASPAEVCEPVVEAAGESESALALAQKENMGLQDKIIMLEEEAVLKATEQKEELEL